MDDALENVRDAIAAVLEIYRDLGKSLPIELAVSAIDQPVRVDLVVNVPLTGDLTVVPD